MEEEKITWKDVRTEFVGCIKAVTYLLLISWPRLWLLRIWFFLTRRPWIKVKIEWHDKK